MFHLPDVKKKTQLFLPSRDTVIFTWKKPRGASYIYMLLIGPGGGGGGGRTGTVGTGRGGGGGGAAGGISSLIVPAIFLPEELFIIPAIGADGGAATSTGSSGQTTRVNLFRPRNTSLDANCIAYADSGPGGAAGGTSGAAAAGTAAAVMAHTIFCSLGIGKFVPGIQGGTGENLGGSSPASVVYGWTQNVMLTGGSGGGSVNTSNVESRGGDVIPKNSDITTNFDVRWLPSAPGGLIGGGNGTNGQSMQLPLLCASGGSGGGGNNTGVGGLGGRGGFGCGGGGGAGGLTGGAGGNGGDGLVVIGWW